jgi:hypothetical protein
MGWIVRNGSDDLLEGIERRGGGGVLDARLR